MIKYIAIFTLLVFCTSCSALQSTHLPCKRRVIEKEELKGLQKDYSITTPKDWQAYYDIHCSVIYLPTNTLNSEGDWNWRRVYLSHVNDTKFYKKYNSVDAFVDDSIGVINERYSNPKIEFSAFKHEIYGEYRVLKFAYKFFEKEYIIASVYLFYKGLGYVITYDVYEDDFETYLPEFQEIVASFKLKIRPN